MTENEYRCIEIRGELLVALAEFESQSRRLFVLFSFLNANDSVSYEPDWLDEVNRKAKQLRGEIWEEKQNDMKRVVTEWNPEVDFDALRAKIQDLHE